MSKVIHPTRRFIRSAGLIVALTVSLLALSGCATSSKISASNEIATARFAIRDARASGAESHAFETLQKADALLAEAEGLKGEEAERKAEKAIAYAQLSATVARRESALEQLRGAMHMDLEAEALRVRTTEAVEERLQ